MQKTKKLCDFPAQTDTPTRQFLHLRPRDHFGGESKNFVKNQSNKEFAVRLHLLEMSGYTHMSHQHGCLNKT